MWSPGGELEEHGGTKYSLLLFRLVLGRVTTVDGIAGGYHSTVPFDCSVRPSTGIGRWLDGRQYAVFATESYGNMLKHAA